MSMFILGVIVLSFGLNQYSVLFFIIVYSLVFITLLKMQYLKVTQQYLNEQNNTGYTSPNKWQYLKLVNHNLN